MGRGTWDNGKGDYRTGRLSDCQQRLNGSERLRRGTVTRPVYGKGNDENSAVSDQQAAETKAKADAGHRITVTTSWQTVSNSKGDGGDWIRNKNGTALDGRLKHAPT